jgi:hypothetical protein
MSLGQFLRPGLPLKLFTLLDFRYQIIFVKWVRAAGCCKIAFLKVVFEKNGADAYLRWFVGTSLQLFSVFFNTLSSIRSKQITVCRYCAGITKVLCRHNILLMIIGIFIYSAKTRLRRVDEQAGHVCKDFNPLSTACTLHFFNYRKSMKSFTIS